MTEKNIREKYLGTIFTKQQTGFNPDSLLHKGKDLKLRNAQVNIEEDPSLSLDCAYNEFDPFIKFGRDNLLFVKREILDKYDYPFKF